MLVFHAKPGHETMQSGAGRPGISAIWPPPLHGRSGLLQEVGSRYVVLKLKIVARPASPRPAGLGLAHLGLPFHRHLDPHVYEVHSGVLAQKILVSAASESFKPCARPFGPFLIKRTCNPWFRGFVHMSLRSCTEDGAHIVEVLGWPAWVCPSFASFLVY